MWLLLCYYDHITWLNSWVLIGLAMECVLVVVWSALIDLGFEHFLLFYYFLAIASLALVLLINDFTLALTVFARSLALSVHSRSEHLHASHNTSSLAASTLLDSTLFSTSTVASAADALTVYCNFGSFSAVNLFKCQLDWVHDRLSLLGARLLGSSASHAKKSTKQVFHATSMGTTFFEAILTVLVVQITLLFVRKNLVGLLNLLKLFFVATSVWVLLEGLLPVGFLDIVISCVLLNFE